ncbi:hypothetical protein F383_34534 [Gossypium arboreum]|uniref:Uncharacterized protein n=1 Tax=Gossypium arboreum TaxID=29729 RepID=A0A0B0N4D0_GOSAR|nr:hypothetical protein F383_34534 [Gossypium arboreum]
MDLARMGNPIKV